MMPFMSRQRLSKSPLGASSSRFTYTHIHMYIYAYIYIYIYIYIFTLSSSRKPSERFLWFPSSTSSNVLYGFRRWFFHGFRRRRKRFLNGFRRWFCMVSVVAGKPFFNGFRRWICGGFCRRRRIQDLRMYRAIPRLLCFQDWFPSLVFVMVSVVAGKRFLMISVVGFCLWFLSWQGTFVYGFRRWFCMVSGCYRTAAVSPMETIKKKKKHQDVSVTN